jgi:hypothetical protein
MIDPAGRLHRLTTVDARVATASRSQTPQAQSFAAELSDELGSTRKISPEAAKLPASLPAGQQSVTWRDSGPTGASTSASTPSAASQPSGLNGLVITFPNAASGSASSARPASSAGTEATSQSFDQAYWASQPPAVQELQNIQNPAERAEVATQLAQEGYTIDVPIMVWGWDPQITTQIRQADGYTWVPSARQPPVEVAPGLTFDGTSYNPANPPPGSISV